MRHVNVRPAPRPAFPLPCFPLHLPFSNHFQEENGEIEIDEMRMSPLPMPIEEGRMFHCPLPPPPPPPLRSSFTVSVFQPLFPPFPLLRGGEGGRDPEFLFLFPPSPFHLAGFLLPSAVGLQVSFPPST